MVYYNSGHNILRYFICYQISLKIISNESGIFEFPHKLPDELRLTATRNYSLMASLPPKMKSYPMLIKNYY